MIASFLASVFSALIITFITPSTALDAPSTPSPTPESSESQAAPTPTTIATKSSELYTVSRVIDGDTVELKRDEFKVTVRLIGIDTPETVDPRRPVQCFGKEASSFLKATIEGKTAELISDSTQGNTDKYNRALRYISVDGQDVGELMIREGYAQEYTYNKPYQKQETYTQREKEAIDNFKGLWNPEACATPAPTPVPSAVPTPSSTSQVLPSPKASPTVKVASPRPIASPVVKQVQPPPKVVESIPPRPAGFSCNCKKTCPNMGCAEAQYQLNSCGCSARDADDDGIACDAQCQ